MKNPKFIDIRGTIHEATSEADPTIRKFVYQKCPDGMGNLAGWPQNNRQRRLWVAGSDPATPAQLAQRAKMAAAVSAWHALTDEQKQTYRRAALNHHLTGSQYFCSLHIRGEIP